LSWPEERSLAVLGAHAAHLEVQLRNAQRLHAAEREDALHWEQQCITAERSLGEARDALKATQKELAALQRHTTGTIKAQEAELSRISDNLRSEEEWSVLVKSVGEGKAAVKAARDELARKSRLVQGAQEEAARARTTIADLESALAARDARIASAARTLAIKDKLIGDLKKKFDEMEADDASAAREEHDAGERLKHAMAQLQRREAAYKQAKARAEQLERDHAQCTAQLSAAQSNAQSASTESSRLRAELDTVCGQRNVLEQQVSELHTQIELWRTKSHLQSAGQKSDLSSLEREARRMAAAYEALKSVVRDVGRAHLTAIERLADTLADLRRDARQEGRDDSAARIDGSLSVRDIHALHIAAEFTNDDLESEAMKQGGGEEGEGGSAYSRLSARSVYILCVRVQGHFVNDQSHRRCERTAHACGTVGSSNVGCAGDCTGARPQRRRQSRRSARCIQSSVG
jgi:SMC interacting uncharacterized protein involved in chromosome segregation